MAEYLGNAYAQEVEPFYGGTGSGGGGGCVLDICWLRFF